MSEANAGLADFYAEGYAVEDPADAARFGRWRALGAAGKAAHVQRLLEDARLTPERLVEIGCGDGALLAELSERGVAGRLDGFELSPTAAALARTRDIPGARRIEAFDGARLPVEDDAYALAVLSHVLEHAPEPAPLLAEAARVAPWVLVEVPLEANSSARRPAKRAEAREIGHLHAFSRYAIHRLLAGAGLRAVAELSDPLARAHHAFFATTPKARATATAKAAFRRAAWRVAPLVAERAFTVHYAVLARRD